MANSVTMNGSVSAAGSVVQVQAKTDYSAPVGTVLNVPLAMGDNVFAVPTGTTSVVIQPPGSNTVLITLKGDATDPVGIALHKTLTTGLINIDMTCLQIVLTVPGPIVDLVNIKFL